MISHDITLTFASGLTAVLMLGFAARLLGMSPMTVRDWASSCIVYSGFFCMRYVRCRGVRIMVFKVISGTTAMIE